jgi:hypothetical protein
MNPIFAISLLLTVTLPIAWLVADFKAKPILRRVLGIFAILWSFGIALLVGNLQFFNANSFFSSATKDLLSSSVEQLKSGKTQSVLAAWEKANSEFNATYENRSQYQQIVDEAIADMKKP